MADLKFASKHGPIIGEAKETEVIVWYRDENGLEKVPIIKYWSQKDQSDLRQEMIEVDAHIDYTSKTALLNLQPATTYFYDLDGITGRFRTAGSVTCNFVFGSCIGGQGFGRYMSDHEDGEGFPIFHAMAALDPDFCQIQGDFVYADNPIEAVGTGMFNKGHKYLLPGGAATELPVAHDLASFRARYKYNLEDKALGGFLRNTTVYNTWDDHGKCQGRKLGLCVCMYVCMCVCVCVWKFQVGSFLQIKRVLWYH